MHGFIYRGLQCFLRDTYGAQFWDDIAQNPKIGIHNFEPLLSYDDQISFDLIQLSTRALGRKDYELLEDFGTYLVSHPNMHSLRRLLRFGGVDFVDFLHSLPDLPDRVRMAVSDMHIPKIDLRECEMGHYILEFHAPIPGMSRIAMGIIRAMADDYGALVSLKFSGARVGIEQITVILHDSQFSNGRNFSLAGDAA